MKKGLILTSLIVLSLSLSACNLKDVTTNNNAKTEANIQKQTDENLKEDSKEVGEDIKEKIDDAVMTDEEMIENSDYIAKVKMIQKGNNKFELKVLENIKGNLDVKTIPNANLLEKNHAHLVFFRDIDGEIEPTNGEDSYVLLEGDNHEIFGKINKQINR